MRIAVSGTHRVGKTTLVAELAARLPGHEVVDEPYHQLEEDGHTFSDPPGFDEFELQLTRSIESLLAGGPDRIFDRCPLDLVAYLAVHEGPGRFVGDRWLDPVDEAMRTLDLVVFVPIETPDRIGSDESGTGSWRRRVDEALADLVVADSWGLGVPVIEVSGSPERRARAVMAEIRRRAASP